MDDLQKLKDTWLGICGACDAGIGQCSHPDGDYRPVMLELVREVERLREQLGLVVGGETREQIEVQTPGLRYPCGDLAAAWRHFGELKADGYDAHIVTRTVYEGPWREVSYAS